MILSTISISESSHVVKPIAPAHFPLHLECLRYYLHAFYILSFVETPLWKSQGESSANLAGRCVIRDPGYLRDGYQLVCFDLPSLSPIETNADWLGIFLTLLKYMLPVILRLAIAAQINGSHWQVPNLSRQRAVILEWDSNPSQNLVGSRWKSTRKHVFIHWISRVLRKESWRVDYTHVLAATFFFFPLTTTVGNLPRSRVYASCYYLMAFKLCRTAFRPDQKVERFLELRVRKKDELFENGSL